MKFVRQLFMALAILGSNHAFAEAQFGKDFWVLESAQPAQGGNKIEVLEFISYNCRPCSKFHSVISSWAKQPPSDVALTTYPSTLRDSWRVSATTFFALESLGQRKQLDDDLFNAFLGGTDEDGVAEFVAEHGVSRNEFRGAYLSFSTQAKMQKLHAMEHYIVRGLDADPLGRNGVPALLVDGRYYISGLTPEETIRVLNGVLEKVRLERANKRAPEQAYCTIEGKAGSCKVAAFIGGEIGNDTEQYTCKKFLAASYVGSCEDGFVDGVAAISRKQPKHIGPDAFIGYFHRGAPAYPLADFDYDGADGLIGYTLLKASSGCIYFNHWDASTEKEECRGLSSMFGSEIFSNNTLTRLRKGTLEIGPLGEHFDQYMEDRSKE